MFQCHSPKSSHPLPPGDLPDPGIEPMSLMSPALEGGLFTPSATWVKGGPGNRGRSACGPTHVARLEFPRETVLSRDSAGSGATEEGLTSRGG